MAVNVDAMNTAYIARSQEVWDKVEKDRFVIVLVVLTYTLQGKQTSVFEKLSGFGTVQFLSNSILVVYMLCAKSSSLIQPARSL